MTLGLRIIEPGRDLNKFFVNPFGSLIDTNLFNENNIVPIVDIYEKENKYLISAELPGLKKNEIDIDFKNNVLTVSGEKKREQNEENDRIIRIERNFGKFERRFKVPENVNAKKVAANYKNGVLEISLPKKEESIPKKIDVKID